MEMAGPARSRPGLHPKRHPAAASLKLLRKRRLPKAVENAEGGHARRVTQWTPPRCGLTAHRARGSIPCCKGHQNWWRAALEDFYATLSDEQKAQFEAIGPKTVRRSQIGRALLALRQVSGWPVGGAFGRTGRELEVGPSALSHSLSHVGTALALPKKRGGSLHADHPKIRRRTMSRIPPTTAGGGSGEFSGRALRRICRALEMILVEVSEPIRELTGWGRCLWLCQPRKTTATAGPREMIAPQAVGHELPDRPRHPRFSWRRIQRKFWHLFGRYRHYHVFAILRPLDHRAVGFWPGKGERACRCTRPDRRDETGRRIPAYAQACSGSARPELGRRRNAPPALRPRLFRESSCTRPPRRRVFRRRDRRSGDRIPLMVDMKLSAQWAPRRLRFAAKACGPGGTENGLEEPVLGRRRIFATLGGRCVAKGGIEIRGRGEECLHRSINSPPDMMPRGGAAVGG